MPNPSACVWDLRLQSFEREEWINHVLRKATAPDFQAYLAGASMKRTRLRKVGAVDA